MISISHATLLEKDDKSPFPKNFRNLSWVSCCSACQVPKGAITLSKLCLEGCQWSEEHGLVEQDVFGKQYYELPDLICYPMEVNTQFWRS